jgi:predicted NAD/FAD-dependent oxidoreductase
MKDRMYSTPEIEGIEQQCVLIVCPTLNASYRVHRWGRSEKHWLLELQDGSQVEIHNDPPLLIHIPKPGLTFELDGTCREVRATSTLVVN